MITQTCVYIFFNISDAPKIFETPVKSTSIGVFHSKDVSGSIAAKHTRTTPNSSTAPLLTHYPPLIITSSDHQLVWHPKAKLRSLLTVAHKQVLHVTYLVVFNVKERIERADFVNFKPKKRKLSFLISTVTNDPLELNNSLQHKMNRVPKSRLRKHGKSVPLNAVNAKPTVHINADAYLHTHASDLLKRVDRQMSSSVIKFHIKSTQYEPKVIEIFNPYPTIKTGPAIKLSIVSYRTCNRSIPHDRKSKVNYFTKTMKQYLRKDLVRYKLKQTYTLTQIRLKARLLISRSMHLRKICSDILLHQSRPTVFHSLFKWKPVGITETFHHVDMKKIQFKFISHIQNSREMKTAIARTNIKMEPINTISLRNNRIISISAESLNYEDLKLKDIVSKLELMPSRHPKASSKFKALVTAEYKLERTSKIIDGATQIHADQLKPFVVVKTRDRANLRRIGISLSSSSKNKESTNVNDRSVVEIVSKVVQRIPFLNLEYNSADSLVLFYAIKKVAVNLNDIFVSYSTVKKNSCREISRIFSFTKMPPELRSTWIQLKGDIQLGTSALNLFLARKTKRSHIKELYYPHITVMNQTRTLQVTIGPSSNALVKRSISFKSWLGTSSFITKIDYDRYLRWKACSAKNAAIIKRSLDGNCILNIYEIYSWALEYDVLYVRVTDFEYLYIFQRIYRYFYNRPYRGIYVTRFVFISEYYQVVIDRYQELNFNTHLTMYASSSVSTTGYSSERHVSINQGVSQYAYPVSRTTVLMRMTATHNVLELASNNLFLSTFGVNNNKLYYYLLMATITKNKYQFGSYFTKSIKYSIHANTLTQDQPNLVAFNIIKYPPSSMTQLIESWTVGRARRYSKAVPYRKLNIDGNALQLIHYVAVFSSISTFLIDLKMLQVKTVDTATLSHRQRIIKTSLERITMTSFQVFEHRFRILRSLSEVKYLENDKVVYMDSPTSFIRPFETFHPVSKHFVRFYQRFVLLHRYHVILVLRSYRELWWELRIISPITTRYRFLKFQGFKQDIKMSASTSKRHFSVEVNTLSPSRVNIELEHDLLWTTKIWKLEKQSRASLQSAKLIPYEIRLTHFNHPNILIKSQSIEVVKASLLIRHRFFKTVFPKISNAHIVTVFGRILQLIVIRKHEQSVHSSHTNYLIHRSSSLRARKISLIKQFPIQHIVYSVRILLTISSSQILLKPQYEKNIFCLYSYMIRGTISKSLHLPQALTGTHTTELKVPFTQISQHSHRDFIINASVTSNRKAVIKIAPLSRPKHRASLTKIGLKYLKGLRIYSHISEEAKVVKKRAKIKVRLIRFMSTLIYKVRIISVQGSGKAVIIERHRVFLSSDKVSTTSSSHYFFRNWIGKYTLLKGSSSPKAMITISKDGIVKKRIFLVSDHVKNLKHIISFYKSYIFFATTRTLLMHMAVEKISRNKISHTFSGLGNKSSMSVTTSTEGNHNEVSGDKTSYLLQNREHYTVAFSPEPKLAATTIMMSLIHFPGKINNKEILHLAYKTYFRLWSNTQATYQDVLSAVVLTIQKSKTEIITNQFHLFHLKYHAGRIYLRTQYLLSRVAITSQVVAKRSHTLHKMRTLTSLYKVFSIANFFRNLQQVESRKSGWTSYHADQASLCRIIQVFRYKVGNSGYSIGLQLKGKTFFKRNVMNNDFRSVSNFASLYFYHKLLSRLKPAVQPGIKQNLYILKPSRSVRALIKIQERKHNKFVTVEYSKNCVGGRSSSVTRQHVVKYITASNASTSDTKCHYIMKVQRENSSLTARYFIYRAPSLDHSIKLIISYKQPRLKYYTKNQLSFTLLLATSVPKYPGPFFTIKRMSISKNWNLYLQIGKQKLPRPDYPMHESFITKETIITSFITTPSLLPLTMKRVQTIATKMLTKHDNVKVKSVYDLTGRSVNMLVLTGGTKTGTGKIYKKRAMKAFKFYISRAAINIDKIGQQIMLFPLKRTNGVKLKSFSFISAKTTPQKIELNMSHYRSLQIPFTSSSPRKRQKISMLEVYHVHPRNGANSHHVKFIHITRTAYKLISIRFKQFGEPEGRAFTNDPPAPHQWHSIQARHYVKRWGSKVFHLFPGATQVSYLMHGKLPIFGNLSYGKQVKLLRQVKRTHIRTLLTLLIVLIKNPKAIMMYLIARQNEIVKSFHLQKEYRKSINGTYVKSLRQISVHFTGRSQISSTQRKIMVLSNVLKKGKLRTNLSYVKIIIKQSTYHSDIMFSVPTVYDFGNKWKRLQGMAYQVMVLASSVKMAKIPYGVFADVSGVIIPRNFIKYILGDSDQHDVAVKLQEFAMAKSSRFYRIVVQKHIVLWHDPRISSRFDNLDVISVSARSMLMLQTYSNEWNVVTYSHQEMKRIDFAGIKLLAGVTAEPHSLTSTVHFSFKFRALKTGEELRLSRVRVRTRGPGRLHRLIQYYVCQDHRFRSVVFLDLVYNAPSVSKSIVQIKIIVITTSVRSEKYSRHSIENFKVTKRAGITFRYHDQSLRVSKKKQMFYESGHRNIDTKTDTAKAVGGYISRPCIGATSLMYLSVKVKDNSVQTWTKQHAITLENLFVQAAQKIAKFLHPAITSFRIKIYSPHRKREFSHLYDYSEFYSSSATRIIAKIDVKVSAVGGHEGHLIAIKNHNTINFRLISSMLSNVQKFYKRRYKFVRILRIETLYSYFVQHPITIHVPSMQSTANLGHAIQCRVLRKTRSLLLVSITKPVKSQRTLSYEKYKNVRPHIALISIGNTPKFTEVIAVRVKYHVSIRIIAVSVSQATSVKGYIIQKLKAKKVKLLLKSKVNSASAAFRVLISIKSKYKLHRSFFLNTSSPPAESTKSYCTMRFEIGYSDQIVTIPHTKRASFTVFRKMQVILIHNFLNRFNRCIIVRVVPSMRGVEVNTKSSIKFVYVEVLTLQHFQIYGNLIYRYGAKRLRYIKLGHLVRAPTKEIKVATSFFTLTQTTLLSMVSVLRYKSFVVLDSSSIRGGASIRKHHFHKVGPFDRIDIHRISTSSAARQSYRIMKKHRLDFQRTPDVKVFTTPWLNSLIQIYVCQDYSFPISLKAVDRNKPQLKYTTSGVSPATFVRSAVEAKKRTPYKIFGRDQLSHGTGEAEALEQHYRPGKD